MIKVYKNGIIYALISFFGIICISLPETLQAALKLVGVLYLGASLTLLELIIMAPPL